MKRVIPFLLLVALLFPQTAASQQIVIEEWTVYRYVIEPLKKLPPGFYHFRPVPESLAALRIPSEGNVLCNSLESTVAFGKRLWLGFHPDQAVQALVKARRRADCGYANGLVLTPVEDAVRGDDANRKIFILRVMDQYGKSHLIGLPKVW